MDRRTSRVMRVEYGVQVVEDQAAAVENRLHIIRIVLLLLGIIGLGCGVAASEIYYRDGYVSSPAFVAVKAANTGTTVLLLILTIVKYSVASKLLNVSAQLLAPETVLLRRRHFFKQCLLELVLCGMHCPVGVQGTFISKSLELNHIIYSYDAVLSVVQLGRVYLFLPVVRDFFELKRTRAQIIAKWHNEADLGTGTFAMRVLLEEHPFHTCLALLTMSTLTLAYAMRTFEQSVCYLPEVVEAGYCGDYTLGSKNYASFAVTVWNILITLATVGYGDIFPLTAPGRVIAMFSVIIGLSILSILIATITNHSQMTPDEQRSWDQLKLMKLRTKRRAAAVKVVYSFMILATLTRRAVMQDREMPFSETMTTNPLNGSKQRRVVIPASIQRRLARTFEAAIADSHVGLAKWVRLLVNSPMEEAGAALVMALSKWRSVGHQITHLASNQADASLGLMEIRESQRKIDRIEERVNEIFKMLGGKSDDVSGSETASQAMLPPEAAYPPSGSGSPQQPQPLFTQSPAAYAAAQQQQMMAMMAASGAVQRPAARAVAGMANSGPYPTQPERRFQAAPVAAAPTARPEGRLFAPPSLAARAAAYPGGVTMRSPHHPQH